MADPKVSFIREREQRTKWLIPRCPLFAVVEHYWVLSFAQEFAKSPYSYSPIAGAGVRGGG